MMSAVNPPGEHTMLNIRQLLLALGASLLIGATSIHAQIAKLLKDLGAKLGPQDRRGYPYQLLKRNR